MSNTGRHVSEPALRVVVVASWATTRHHALVAQTVVPMIAYVDAGAAIDWLTDAFGFRERERIGDEDGTIMHAELETNAEGGVVMLATPSSDYEGPRRHGERCERARAWLAVPWVVDGVLVYVDDVDAHFARARSKGARILSEPEDGPPARRYRAEDIEGHRWMFMQRA
jgi:uncharacterized glyoxalase superfamily protein PhnB